MNGVGMRSSYNGDSSNPNLNAANTTLNRSLNDLDTSKKSEIETPPIQVSFYVNMVKGKKCTLFFEAFNTDGKQVIDEYKYRGCKPYEFIATLPSSANYMIIKIDQLIDCRKILFNNTHIVYNVSEKMITTDELNSRPLESFLRFRQDFKKI